MQDLIEALTILSAYISPENRYPTLCCHDEFHVMAHNDVTEEERTRLEEIGFIWSESDENWVSFRFGSC